MSRILVVDNYDSFVYTIVGYLGQLGARTVVVRNDVLAVPTGASGFADAAGRFDGVLVSPGPGTPAEAGASEDVIRACARSATPMLGVCLGHQALAEVFGATVTHAPELMHGKTSLIAHTGTGVFTGLPAPMLATRYHSLAVVPQTVPAELEIIAWSIAAGEGSQGPDRRMVAGAGAGRRAAWATPTGTVGGVVMGLAHRELPLFGVQFHPESVLTTGGHLLLANWLALCGAAGAVPRAAGLAPLVRAG